MSIVKYFIKVDSSLIIIVMLRLKYYVQLLLERYKERKKERKKEGKKKERKLILKKLQT